MTQNHLFYIAAFDEAGENIDLLVIAKDSAQARHFWQAYYELAESAPAPALVAIVPGVTPTANPGAIDWTTVQGT